jgi:hypothetical protein
MRFVDYVRNHYVVLGTRASYSSFIRLSCKICFDIEVDYKKPTRNSEKGESTPPSVKLHKF